MALDDFEGHTGKALALDALIRRAKNWPGMVPKGVAVLTAGLDVQQDCVVLELVGSRDAMTAGSPAHRFRRWVTGEVLPSIRRSGTYGGAAEPGFRDKVFAVEKTERIFGTEAAKEMWFHLRLPVTPSMRAQRSLFPRPGEGG